jgi:hypothetical protein
MPASLAENWAALPHAGHGTLKDISCAFRLDRGRIISAVAGAHCNPDIVRGVQWGGGVVLGAETDPALCGEGTARSRKRPDPSVVETPSG